ncbi:acid-sensing ion channel 3-like isoform X2 [Haliotis rubra]|nr:acid-sensing ion channel 3-like isoform X2 [Haliotis rubra]
MSPPVDGTSLSKKWTAVKVVVDDYMSTATVHGFSRVIGKQLYFGRRFFWLLVVLGAGVALAIQVYAEFEVYNARPTLIKEQFRDIVDMVKELPTISLCPLKGFEGIVNHSSPSPLTREEMVMQRFAYPSSHISESLLSSVHIKVYGWDDTGHPDTPGRQTFLSPFRLQELSASRFLNRSWEISDGLPAFFNDSDSGEVLKILARSSRVLDVKGCPRKIQSLYDLPCCSNFFSEVFTETGVCQTLNMTALIKEGKRKGFFAENRFLVVVDAMMQTDLTMFTNVKGIQVVVHASDDPVMPTKSGVFVPSATHSKLTIDTTKRINLPPPFTTADGFCIDTDAEPFSRVLTRFPEHKYSLYACERECLINYTVSVCGCRHPWDPGAEDICSITRTVECIWEAVDQLVKTQLCGHVTVRPPAYPPSTN